MRLYPLILSLFLLVFSVAVYAQKNILILGDSISAAYGMQVKEGWVSLLKLRLNEKKYDYAVINASISGVTTNQGLASLPALLKKYHPSLTVIELGGNDFLLGMPPETVKQNLVAIIKLCKTANSKILLISIRLPPNYGKQYNKMIERTYQEIAYTQHITLVPLYSNDINHDLQLLQEDRLHPSQKAQIIILNRLWIAIEPLLK